MRERTLVIIKPDAVMQGVADQIKQRYLDAGLEIVNVDYTMMSQAKAQRFYAEHEGKPFFQGLILAMASGPIFVLLIEGEDAIDIVRKMNGATDPRKAEPSTIRHDFMSAGGPFNAVHGSDSPEAAEREIALMFG